MSAENLKNKLARVEDVAGKEFDYVIVGWSLHRYFRCDNDSRISH